MIKKGLFSVSPPRTTVNLLLGLFSLFLMHGCSGESGGQSNGGTKTVPAVEALQARQGSLPLTQRLSGLVKAKNQVAIHPEIGATIVEVYVNNGHYVKKGAPLVRLREKEFRERFKQATAGHQITMAQLRQADAQLKEVQAEYNRTKQLAAQGLTSSTDLETAETRTVSAEASVSLAQARVEQAQATMEEQQETLHQTIIRAPISGNVGDRNAEVGMLVNTSTRLFTIGQMDSVRVEVVLTDRMLNYIETGQRSEVINAIFSPEPQSAKLARISPFLNPLSHSTDAEIDLSNLDGQLKPGMFVTVDIFYGESEEATLVPLSALYENPLSGKTGVYITRAISDREVADVSTMTEPKPFEFVPVEVVARGRMEAGIRGVKPGEWVITLGQYLLGGEAGEARVRPVKWAWVEKLQKLQREDLVQEMVKKQTALPDSTLQNSKQPK